MDWGKTHWTHFYLQLITKYTPLFFLVEKLSVTFLRISYRVRQKLLEFFCSLPGHFQLIKCWNKRSLLRKLFLIKITTSAAPPVAFGIISSSLYISSISNYSMFVSYLQNMNTSGFRACVKELYETTYDPVSVTYAVVTG